MSSEEATTVERGCELQRNLLPNRCTYAPGAGKTTCINHFLINGDWHLVDLPGYG